MPFINMGDRSGEALEYFRLSEYYAAAKQYDKALQYLKKHHQLRIRMVVFGFHEKSVSLF